MLVTSEMNTAPELIASAYLQLLKECDKIKKQLADARSTINSLTDKLSQAEHKHTDELVRNLDKLETMMKLEDEIRALREENLLLKHKNLYLMEQNLQLDRENGVLAETNFCLEMNYESVKDDLEMLKK